MHTVVWSNPLSHVACMHPFVLVYQQLVSKAIPSPFSTPPSPDRSVSLTPRASFLCACADSVAPDWESVLHSHRLQKVQVAAPEDCSGKTESWRDSGASSRPSPDASTGQTPSLAPCSRTHSIHFQTHSTSFSHSETQPLFNYVQPLYNTHLLLLLLLLYDASHLCPLLRAHLLLPCQ